MNLPRETLLSLYFQMLRIRKVELRIESLYHLDEMKTPIHLCIGRGWGSAAQHSQALQGLFMHVPGLKLVMPSTCYDAKGLMLSAIADGIMSGKTISS